MSERTSPVRVWDLPTRLFHWAIVILLGAAWLSERVNWMQTHLVVGYSILSLLIFRLAWGFVGSDTSRFSRFLKSPLAALRQLARLHRREPDTEIGHNAAGGWMVLLLLALLAVQVGTGLFANDDGDTEGPLFSFVTKEQSDWLSRIHWINYKLIKLAVFVHIAAVLAYMVVKRHDLIRPMITGWKYLPQGIAPPRLASTSRAIVLLVIAVGTVGVLVNVF